MATKTANDTIIETPNRMLGRDTIRSRLVLEVASELVDQTNWKERQVRVSLRQQGADEWPITLFASDGPAAIDQVARGEVQLAIINPAGFWLLPRAAPDRLLRRSRYAVLP